jgi:uncharacterized protein (DUF488 family)
MRVYTIGHSNQSLDSFLTALTAHAVSLVVDVRRFPSSRRHPHFGGARLQPALAAAGIDYVHAPDLGGHRVPTIDSPHTALREGAFRGYADHMDTPAFAAAVDGVLAQASTRRVAVMCAERDWRDCHRGLMADYLKVRGHDVVHILSADAQEPHPYTRSARIVDGALSYRGLL